MDVLRNYHNINRTSIIIVCLIALFVANSLKPQCIPQLKSLRATQVLCINILMGLLFYVILQMGFEIRLQWYVVSVICVNVLYLLYSKKHEATVGAFDEILIAGIIHKKTWSKEWGSTTAAGEKNSPKVFKAK